MEVSVYQVKGEWFLNNGGRELVEAHMQEAGPQVKQIDFETYFQLESTGVLLILVAMDEGMNIQGYVIGTVCPSIHRLGEFVFNTTAFYCRPELRRSNVSAHIMNVLKQFCKGKDITEIVYSVLEGLDAGHAFAQAMGMQRAEVWYKLDVEDE